VAKKAYTTEREAGKKREAQLCPNARGVNYLKGDTKKKKKKPVREK